METTLNKGKISRDLTSGNLVKKIIFYLIPLFLTSVLQLLFTTMDIFTVTHFGGGNSSSGAIGSTNSLVVLILCVFQGLAAGAGVVISNAKGAKDFDKISKSVGSCTLIMIISGIFVSIFGVLFARKLLLLLNTSDEFIDNATLYLTIYFIGAPLNLLQNSGAAILRSLGDSKRPFVATIFSGITNICLNFLFVIGFNQDVKGVAIATIASQGICALVLYLFLMKDKRLSGNFSFRYLRFYKEETLEIIRLGFFTGLQSFIFNFTNVNVQRCVNELGAAQVIGKSAGSSIEGYEYVLLNAISTTCLVAVGQNFGAKKARI